jgi:hypothetical protein
MWLTEPSVRRPGWRCWRPLRHSRMTVCAGFRSGSRVTWWANWCIPRHAAKPWRSSTCWRTSGEEVIRTEPKSRHDRAARVRLLARADGRHRLARSAAGRLPRRPARVGCWPTSPAPRRASTGRLTTGTLRRLACPSPTRAGRRTGQRARPSLHCLADGRNAGTGRRTARVGVLRIAELEGCGRGPTTTIGRARWLVTTRVNDATVPANLSVSRTSADAQVVASSRGPQNQLREAAKEVIPPWSWRLPRHFSRRSEDASHHGPRALLPR